MVLTCYLDQMQQQGLPVAFTTMFRLDKQVLQIQP